MNNIYPMDAYTTVIARLKKRRIVAGITSVLIFGGLSLLSAQGLLQTHWLSFVLLSFAAGCWLLFFSHLVSWLLFLRPRIKNNPESWITMYPIATAVKKLKSSINAFAIFTGCLFFCFLFFLLQQPDNDNTTSAIEVSDFIGGIVMGAVCSLVTFLLTTNFIAWFLSPKVFKNMNSHNPLQSMEDFQENYSFMKIQKSRINNQNYVSKSWEDWDHNPMNPASAEYQSTYRHWNHED